jgi:hypothetical protein
MVVPRDPALRPPELMRHLRAQGIAAFKVPDRVAMVPTLPHTAVGKVDKVALRQALAAGLAAGAFGPPSLTTNAGAERVVHEAPRASHNCPHEHAEARAAVPLGPLPQEPHTEATATP